MLMISSYSCSCSLSSNHTNMPTPPLPSPPPPPPPSLSLPRYYKRLFFTTLSSFGLNFISFLCCGNASQVFRLLDSSSCELEKDLLGTVSVFTLLQDRRRGNSHPSNVDVVQRGESQGRWANVDPEACGMLCVVTTHLYWHPQG